MKKFTLSIALVAIVGMQAYSQDLKQITSLPFNAGKTIVNRSAKQAITLQPRGGAPAIAVAYTDDFNALNDTDNLKLRGYIPYYRGGGPQGTTATWYQGAGAAAGTFDAFNGAATDYVAANYNVVTAANNIDSWLVLPALNVSAGDIMSFYSQSIIGSIYPDSLRVMYSAVGDSTPEDLSWVQLDNFVVNINGMWELKTFTAPAAGTTARFAIRYNVVDGGPNGANSNYIGIDQLDVFTPAVLDGGVSAIAPIAPNCAGLSAAETITVAISNYGATPISNFSVSYTINGGAPVTETYTGTIAPSATSNYTFTQTADLSVFGNYTIAASTSITGDTNAGNDGSSTTTSSGGATVTPGTPFSEGFESTAVGTIPPTGWSTEDTDGDGNSWDFTNAYPHNGTMCSRVPFPTGGPAENWLFTPCLNLTTGTNYQIEYWYKSFDDQMWSFEVEPNFGTAPNSASMTTNIAPADPLFADSSYHLASHAFTVPSNGVYYIGFKGFSAAASVSLRMDDAAISIITGINEVSNQNNLIITPNPTDGILNITGKIIDKNLQLVITNALGQSVYTAKYNEAFKTQVDLSGFANGIYTVQLITSKETITKKITLEK